jgi:exopolyphosphatase/guanosine-5'-triphosphate,3'-diphosphate pyrophosphatase
MEQQRIGLIDVGSNTVRLVIFEIDEHNKITELQNIKTPARLVQYVQEGKMSTEGVDKLVNILSSFAETAGRYDIQKLIPVATAAVRQSKNAKAILKRVKKETGIPLEILSEEQEAYYGNYAARYTMDIEDGITIDIGGGSTELTLFKDKEVLSSHSFPFGAVSLKQQFFSDVDHNDKKAIKEARKWVTDQFKQLDWVVDASVPLIGIGGSARNIAEVYQMEHDYPIAGMHGYEMAGDALKETVELFTELSMKKLGKLDGLSQDRKDIIIPAGIVFTELFDVMNASTFALSSRGLREGLVMEYLNDHFNEPYELHSVQRQTVYRLAKQYGHRAITINQRITIADQLLAALQNKGILEVDEEHLQLLHYGAALYYIGSFIEDDSKSQHTFYVVSNSNLHGFNHYDRVRVALLASYKNRSLYKQYTKNLEGWFSEEEWETLMYLGSVIKFAEALNDSHVNIVRDIALEKAEDGYVLTVTFSGDIIAEEYRANKQKNHLERVLNDSVEIVFESEKNLED